MTNEREAEEVYRFLLEELTRIGATDLAMEIKLAIARGVVRKDAQGKNNEINARELSSPTEALGVALRLLLSALDPLFMTEETRNNFFRLWLQTRAEFEVGA